MNNPNLEQLHTLKSLSLTDTERGLVRAHAHYLIANTPVPSTYQSLFQRGVYHGLRIALSSFVFFIFVGGTVIAVANQALPGDSLYPVKTQFNEQVVAMFHKTPEEKVAYNAKRVETRVKEIKTLAESQTLTKAKQATVQKVLDEHIKDLSTNLDSVAPNIALTATANLEQALTESKAVIENASTDTTTKAGAIQTVDGALQKVADQEVKIISKEIDSITSSVSATIVNTPLTPDPATPSSLGTPVGP